MTWHRASHYHLVSACGGYSVSRSWCSVRQRWTYHGWQAAQRSADGHKRTMEQQLAVGTKDDCLTACETHAARQGGQIS